MAITESWWIGPKIRTKRGLYTRKHRSCEDWRGGLDLGPAGDEPYRTTSPKAFRFLKLWRIQDLRNTGQYRSAIYARHVERTWGHESTTPQKGRFDAPPPRSPASPISGDRRCAGGSPCVCGTILSYGTVVSGRVFRHLVIDACTIVLLMPACRGGSLRTEVEVGECSAGAVARCESSDGGIHSPVRDRDHHAG
jgi:hypothetical protein